MISVGLLKSNLKRFWVLPAIVAIIIFLSIPFSMMLDSDNFDKLLNEEVQVDGEYLSASEEYKKAVVTRTLSSYVNVLIIITFPISVCIQLLKYANKTSSTAFIHGLPLSRKKIYLTNILSGIILMLIPYILNSIILLLLKLFGGEFYTYLAIVDILKWVGVSMLFNTTFFAFATLVGTFTGMGFAHGLLTYICMYIPILFFLIFELLLQHLIFGFPGFSDNVLELLSKLPFIRIFTAYIYGYDENIFSAINIKYIIAYLVIIAICLVLGYFIYKKRKLERTKEFVVYKGIRTFLKYLGTFTITILAYLYSAAVIEAESIYFNVIFALSIGLVGYVIIAMILKKSYKILKELKGYLIYAVIFISVVFVINIDLFGYVNRVPNIKDIEYASYYSEYIDEAEKVKYKNTENMQLILDAHREILNSKKDMSYANRYIEYKLKNGTVIKRKYDIPTEIQDDLDITLEQTEEYITGTYYYIYDEQYIKNIKNIYVSGSYDGRNIDIEVSNSRQDEEVFNRLIECLQIDLKENKTHIRDNSKYANKYSGTKYLYFSFTLNTNGTTQKEYVYYYTITEDTEFVKFYNELSTNNSLYI